MVYRRWSAVIVIWSAASGCGPSAHQQPDARYPLFQEAVGKYRAGDTIGALTLFERGLHAAVKAQDARDQARFHSGIGLCHMARHQYSRALGEFQAALDWARRNHGNPQQNDLCASAAINIATVYARMHDYENAIRASGDALRYRPGPGQSALLRLNLAVYHGEAGHGERTHQAFREVIAGARQDGDRQTLARALVSYFFPLLREGRIADAEATLNESVAIRAALDDPELADTDVAMAHLRLAQRRFGDALDAVARYRASGRTTYWPGEVDHLAGRILAQAGRREEALGSFRQAIDAARRQRIHIRPAEQFVISSEAKLSEIYSSFAGLAMDLYCERRDPRLLAEAIAAAEEMRVSGQRSAYLSPESWSDVTPAGYQETLFRLDALVRQPKGQEPEIDRLKLRLLEYEARMAEEEPLLVPAPADSRTYLKELQASVAENEAVFGFHFSRVASLGWLITREGVQSRRIEQAAGLPHAIAEYSRLLKAKDPSAPQAGRLLFAQVFGELFASAATKSYWTLVLDGPLFELPFPMLPVPGGEAVLAERFRLSLMPSFQPNRSSRRKAAVRPIFAGLGDPVYNRADPRYRGTAPEPSVELARLPGSAAEVRKAAGIWQQAGYETRLLIGADASTEQLREVARAHPGVLHLATHAGFVADTPYLSLSLRDGAADRLSPQALSAFRLPGALVMMAGCSSGVGAVLPGAGLQGLTRAWLLSGAGAVVASLWPVPDDNGELAAVFYQRVNEIRKEDPEKEVDRPGARRLAWARALQEAMIQVRDAGRTPTVTWAAYYLMGRN